jgi:hypothetical protein
MIGSLRQDCCCLFLCLLWVARIDIFVDCTWCEVHALVIPSFGLRRSYRVGEVPAVGLADLTFLGVSSYLCAIILSSSR